MGIAIIVIIGLLAYVAEQELRELIAKKDKQAHEDEQFEAILKQGYISLSYCRSAQDYLNVLTGWGRRLAREYGKNQTQIQKITELLEEVHSAYHRYRVNKILNNL